MKRILFDIIHLAHLNFFKNNIMRLKKEGHDVRVSYLDRGVIGKVLKKELPGVKAYRVGKYRKSKVGKIFMALDRIIVLRKLISRNRFNVTLGVGDFPLAIASRLCSTKTLQFYDDYEFKINYNLSKFFSNRFFIPKSIEDRDRKVTRYNSFKELAYLHPNAYKPNTKFLKKYGVKEDSYIFVREVSSMTMNYSELQEGSLLPVLKELHKKGKKILLSLEDKSNKKEYAKYSTVLEEPLEDIYSLIAYAKLMISSGDSMARECALLGVPCIYTGGREMMVNNPFLSWKGIFKIEDKEDVLSKVENLLKTNYKKKWKKRLKNLSFVDTNDVIYKAI